MGATTGKAKRPDVARYADARDERTRAWIESRVAPYCQLLLDRAQSRLTRHRISFNDGMGMSNFYLDPETPGYRGDRLDSAIGAAAAAIATSYEPVGGRRISARDRRYAERFPELVEFLRIVNDLDEYLGQGIGEMNGGGA